MSKYRNIYKKLWKDKDFRKSSKDSKLLFLYLSTNESINNSGVYEIPLETISFETGIKLPTVKQLLVNHSIKNIYFDEENEMIFVKNAKKYNPGGNPALVEKGIIGEFVQNSKTFLWNYFIDVNPYFKTKFPTVVQPLPNGSLQSQSPSQLPSPSQLEDLNKKNGPFLKPFDQKNGFYEICEIYPLRLGKASAETKYREEIKSPVTHAMCFYGVINYLSYVEKMRAGPHVDLGYKHMQTYFNKQRWKEHVEIIHVDGVGEDGKRETEFDKFKRQQKEKDQGVPA